MQTILDKNESVTVGAIIDLVDCDDESYIVQYRVTNVTALANDKLIVEYELANRYRRNYTDSHNEASKRYYRKNRNAILSKMKSKREGDRKQTLQDKITKLQNEMSQL